MVECLAGFGFGYDENQNQAAIAHQSTALPPHKERPCRYLVMHGVPLWLVHWLTDLLLCFKKIQKEIEDFFGRASILYILQYNNDYWKWIQLLVLFLITQITRAGRCVCVCVYLMVYTNHAWSQPRKRGMDRITMFLLAATLAAVRCGCDANYTRNDFPHDFAFGSGTSAYHVWKKIFSSLFFFSLSHLKKEFLFGLWKVGRSLWWRWEKA